MSTAATKFSSEALQVVVFLILSLGTFIADDRFKNLLRPVVFDVSIRKLVAFRIHQSTPDIWNYPPVQRYNLQGRCTSEKVHTVWSPISRRRFSSPQYKICFFSLVLYALPAVSLLSNSLHKIRVNDGVCVLELVHYAAYYLVAYDIASIIALTSSTANAVMFVLLKNSEVGWVIVNSVTLFWVSHYGLQNDEHARACSRSQSDDESIRFKSFITTQNSNNLESKSSDVAAEMTASELPSVPSRPLEVPIIDVNGNQSQIGHIIQHDKDSKDEEFDHHASDFSSVSRSTDPEVAIVAIRTSSVYVDVDADEINSFTGPESVVFASMPPVSQTDHRDHTRNRSLSSSMTSVSLPVLIVRGRIPETGPSAILSEKL
ncbi:hypothetical protein F5877DRAFT_66422 [Lentinula edodes]|nr:hypothetical protein F5877DRAFT_66422 [Lentinula edodes]